MNGPAEGNAAAGPGKRTLSAASLLSLCMLMSMLAAAAE